MRLVHRSLSRRVTAAGALVTAVGVGCALSLGVGAGPTQAQPAHQPRAADPIQAPALPGAPPIGRADRVYTADQTSNTVTVINPRTRTVLGTIALGDQRLGGDLGPQYLRDVDVHGLGFSRDGRYLDVISVTTNTVTVLRTVDNSVVSQTSVGRASHEGFFSPDGATVWVADRALAQLDIVDALHGGVVGHVATDDGPSKVLFSPDGRYAYVNHLRSATIDVIQVSSRKVVQRITGLADVFCSDMALSPDGGELWAAHKKVGKVSVVDLRSGTVTSVLTTGADTNHPAFVTTRGAGYVYLTIGGENTTKIYRRRPGHPPVLVGRVPSSGVEPHGIWPSPDNSTVYVVNEHSDSVDIIDTATRTRTTTLRVGQEGQALVYVAGAVPTGPGTQNLVRQGLGQPVRNAAATVTAGPGHVLVTVRGVKGLDMVQLQGSGLTPNATYTAYARRGDDRVPLMSFTADAQGAAPQVLAFVKFLGVYDITTVQIRPGQ
ncbi:YncE family protein [Dermatophilaceae bacterium Soc4.6]